MDWGGSLAVAGILWSLINLVVLLAVVSGFVLLVVSVWKQAKAQEKMAATLQEIADKLNRS